MISFFPVVIFTFFVSASTVYPSIASAAGNKSSADKFTAHSTNYYKASNQAKEILDQIEDACDQMEYDGSRMFDEYMDRTMLLSMADKIYDKMNYQEKEDCPKQERKLHQMIVILIGGEIYHRRCRYRTKKNMFRS